jgi:outer membrane protein with beta-barrel domain
MKNLSRLGGALSHRRFIIGVALICALTGIRARAQGHSLPTATRAGDLQLGGGVVLGSSNYNFNETDLVGAAFYTTFDVRSHWGGEANFHQISSSEDSTVYERTYEIGPRLYALRGFFEPYAKVLYGRGVYNFSRNVANIAYNVYTMGGGADFRVTRSLNIRGDYEYQTWPGFPIAALHPSVVTIGVAFHFHE